jgi:hypothetical protein
VMREWGYHLGPHESWMDSKAKAGNSRGKDGQMGGLGGNSRLGHGEKPAVCPGMGQICEGTNAL